MDWRLVLNVVGTAVVSGGLVTLTTWQTAHDGGWETPLVAGAVSALTTLSAHLRRSPLP